jgi:hypothetical protein
MGNCRVPGGVCHFFRSAPARIATELGSMGFLRTLSMRKSLPAANQRPGLLSVADRYQIVFAQELQFDPTFEREGIDGKPVLPKAKAHAQPVGGQR